MNPHQIIRVVHATRIPLDNEKAAQAALADAFEAEGLSFQREVRLTEEDIPDFMFEVGLAVEVKIKGQKRAIFRQCERYCNHPDVTALILVTGVATGFPPDILGKPCWVASLGRAWL